MSKKLSKLTHSPGKGSRHSKSVASGLQIHFSPGSDSDEGSAELVTSIKTLIKSKASSLDSAYNEIANLLRSDTTTLPHKKKDKHSKATTEEQQHSGTRRSTQEFFDPLTNDSDDEDNDDAAGHIGSRGTLSHGPCHNSVEPRSTETIPPTEKIPSIPESEPPPINKDTTTSSASTPTKLTSIFSQLSTSLFEKSSSDSSPDDEQKGALSRQPSKSSISETLSNALTSINNAVRSDSSDTGDSVAKSVESNKVGNTESKNNTQHCGDSLVFGAGENVLQTDDPNQCDQQVFADDKLSALENDDVDSGETVASENPLTKVEEDSGNDSTFQSTLDSPEEPVEIHQRSSSTGSLSIVRSWDDGSVDPLTALSLEADDEDEFDVPAIARSRSNRGSSDKELSADFTPSSLNDQSKQPEPNVPKSESLPSFPNSKEPLVLKQKSDSIDIVDDFYDVEPTEEFDGSINVRYISQSLPNSPTHATFHENAGLRQVLKRKLKKTAAPKVSVKPLQFSSLAKDAVKQEEAAAIEQDKLGLKDGNLDELNLDKSQLNKNQSSNKSLLEYMNDYPTPPPWFKIFSVTMCIFAYLILPIPSFLSGVILGTSVTFAILRFYMWLSEPTPPTADIVLENLDALPPLEVPETQHTNYLVEDNEIVYEGWMNELTKPYDFEMYHVSETLSIFLTLQGTSLRLRRPKTNVPKHHVWYESTLTPPFIHQRHYDLVGCSVFLRPEGLVKKRVWSKKYPICVVIKQKMDLLNPNSKEFRSAGNSSIKIPEMSKAKDGRESMNKGTAKESETKTKSSIQSQGNASLRKNPTNETKTSSKTEKDKSSKAASEFVVVSKDSCEETLYLFARTCREKEEWFYRLKAASKGQPLVNTLKSIVAGVTSHHHSVSTFQSDQLESEKWNSSRQGSISVATHKRNASNESMSTMGKEMSCILTTPQELLEEYVTYMGHVMPTKPRQTHRPSLSPHRSIPCDPQLMWLNALIGRGFFDFLRIGHWKNKVRDKIQKKLNKIHVPYFIDQLTMTDIDLGGELPTIRRSSKPFLDDRGLWIDLDIAYGGGFRMTLETKVNLMKLKKSGHKRAHSDTTNVTSIPHHLNQTTSSIMDTRKLAVTHSDEEDSAESSSDDEAAEAPPDPDSAVPTAVSKTARGAGKKILKIIDTITDTKFFQNATENKYVKRAMENVSNTKLVLNVEVVNLSGVLALNIAPPPSDRLWYGFRTNPTLTLSAKPRVGEREVSMSRVTEWIEKKLSLEFQKVWVIPNMDDIVVPFMKASKHEEAEDDR